MTLPRTHTSPKASHTGSILECPECSQGTELAATELADGALVTCQHCGSDLIVVREWIDEAACYHLALHDPDEEDFPEDRD